MIDINPRAVLSLDLQNEIVHPDGKFAAAGMPAQVVERGLLPKAAEVLEHARSAGLPVGHVRVAFRPD